METITFGIFATGLLLSILLERSILYALFLGYIIFFIYGLLKKHSIYQMIQMSLEGVRTVKNILLVFLLIGIITAVWRGAGTIPMIIYSSSKLIVPSAFILIVFLLNCLVSVLIGTAFGTAATIGVICMMIGNIMGENPLYVGGAILSGIYFGDRCSPMSTSAFLVSTLTKTDIFQNIKQMIHTSAIPFTVTCVAYLLIGIAGQGEFPSLDILQLFAENFVLNWITVLPAALVLLLSLFNINVKYTMIISILAASIICVVIQQMDVLELLQIMVTGYRAKDPQLAAMIDGGGILSMLKVSAIVCISSSYSGIFDGTRLLEKFKKHIALLACRFTPFGSTLATSILASMIACNQTLTIMLTHQLCKEIIKDQNELAITLEDTAVVVAPLIPWSIAAAVPIAAVSAPVSCILAACYLYLLPIVNLLRAKKQVSPCRAARQSE
ncbi:Na+/H+ antiporter NhaC family protein [Clostridium formicaceticum]|uniref:Malate-2H(+)/Na(+)-lactate antiporter n=1 Tax=Clostridium formicaceticum TaxID=1497 RepID=A0AAC9RLB5_9CLOT|nr:Na+/H+ antiporter NhaC family protein [Clostridium formicaceticum]AOY77146.1 sodium:proton antiporter [Clostridium formicaceticum]ARE87662.1 Malate-2H(+)/Na(+)-lactate antiporter [Clostridium formicaceticum]